MYHPAPQHIPRLKFYMSTPNAVHQADLLFLPYDKLPRGHRVYKYTLTLAEMASRYKEAGPSPRKILMRLPGPSRRFTGNRLSQIHGGCQKRNGKPKTYIRRGRTEIHHDQAFVERFNRTLAERQFGHQYAVEMRLPVGQRSMAWVKRLPEVVAALNNEVMSLTGKKPTEAIKEKAVVAKPSTTYSRPVCKRGKSSPPS